MICPPRSHRSILVLVQIVFLPDVNVPSSGMVAVECQTLRLCPPNLRKYVVLLCDHFLSNLTVLQADEQQSPMFYIHSEASRPQTPHTANTVYPSPQETLPLGTDSNDVALQVQSPRYPSTTAPVTSGYPSYALYPTHSPSTSTSNSNPRSASPALSAVSALTTVSSHSTPTSQTLTPFPLPQIGTLTPIAPRQKQRKQRLFNVDRKAICVYQRDHPLQRQEDIAMRYGVERSTISKILKHKTKWLNVPEHDELRVAKHRFVFRRVDLC